MSCMRHVGILLLCCWYFRTRTRSGYMKKPRPVAKGSPDGVFKDIASVHV